MEEKDYLTIKEAGEASLIIKKSEFVCTMARTNTEKEARAFIAAISSEHYRATHNCFAYTIGMNDEIQRQSDNGEPSGTAGVPMLEVLKNLGLHNVTAVVTRYFGGIKLGTGGLIRAYSKVVSQAASEIGIVKRTVQTEISCIIEYHQSGKLQNYLANENIFTIDTLYTDKVTVQVAIPKDQVETFQQAIINLLNGQVEFNVGDNRYFEVPYHG